MKRSSRARLSRLDLCELLFSDGKTNEEAALVIGVDVRTIRRYASQLRKEDRDPRGYNPGGRPRKIVGRSTRLLRREALHGKCGYQKDLARVLQDSHGVQVSRWTVMRELKRHNIISCRKKKRAWLSKAHMAARLMFAREHKDWTVHDWAKVLWSDEKRFDLQRGDGPKRCFRERGAPLRERDCQGKKAHGGGGIMVWGCIGRLGVGRMVLLEGSVTAEAYIRKCGPSIMHSMIQVGMGTEDGVFMQDNATPHIARSSMEWFAEEGINLLKWPPRSPDMNPIENLWADMVRRLEERPAAQNLDELWEIVLEEWNSTPFSVVWNLLESMPRRMAAVLRAKGGYTKY